MLFNPITTETFHNYILNEALYINHCSLNKNIDVLSDDYRVFRVIAKTDIKKHDELFADYNLVHKHFPFIAPALPNYVSC
jgi:SET domain-containing protein